MKNLLVVILTSFLFSCGSTDSNTIASSEINAAYDSLLEAAPEISSSIIFDQKMSYSKKPTSILFVDTLTGLWDSATLTFSNINGSSNTNIQGFVENSLNPTFSQSPLERIKMPFIIACCLEKLAAKTGDNFTVGADQSFTFSNTVVGVCGDASDLSSLIGEELTYTVTDTSNTTNYDQMIHIDSDDNPMFETEDQWIYIRNNDSVLNLMHASDLSAAEDGSELTVSTMAYDKTELTGVFQFYTKYTTTDVKLFRIYFDEGEDDSELLVYKYNPTSTEEVAMSLSSTYETQTYTAIAIGWDNMAGAYPDPAGGVAGACILNSASTLVTGSDGTSACTSNSKTAKDISGLLTGGIGDDSIAINGATVRTNTAAGDMDDNLPSFTATTIHTASLGI